jgi:hypothetical protein
MVMHRRHFLSRGAVASLGGSGALGFLGELPRVAAADAQVLPKGVRLGDGVEPLVRLLEETPRERLMEEVAQRIRGGVPYREWLAALLLAGVRNIQPRPVGFKFHAVLVVHSAHLASLNAPDGERWLPLLWAMDQFKSSQARDVEEGNWTMGAVDEAAVPGPEKARAVFEEAMDRWDEVKADSAVAGFVRGAGAQEIFEVFCRYGARDFRDIGHKAIYVANSWRTLQTIGWHHAEPVLRSLAYALLEHEAGNPAERDEEADRPGRVNSERLRGIRAGWVSGDGRAGAVAAVLDAVRGASWDESSARVVELLNAGAGARAVWDGIFSGAAEMLMRKPGIITLHAVTTANALHYAFGQVRDDATRRLLLLQAASFMSLFRQRGEVSGGTDLAVLEPEAGAVKVEDIFASMQEDRLRSSRQVLRYLKDGGERGVLVAAAQRQIYLKGTDSHDYKFSSAVFEDSGSVGGEWGERYLAASTHWLKGSGGPDNPLVGRIRGAFS